jgi:hypothetical protein
VRVRGAPAADEQRASAGARSAPALLLHLWRSKDCAAATVRFFRSGGAGTGARGRPAATSAPIREAPRARRSCSGLRSHPERGGHGQNARGANHRPGHLTRLCEDRGAAAEDARSPRDLERALRTVGVVPGRLRSIGLSGVVSASGCWPASSKRSRESRHLSRHPLVVPSGSASCGFETLAPRESSSDRSRGATA